MRLLCKFMCTLCFAHDPFTTHLSKTPPIHPPMLYHPAHAIVYLLLL